MLVKLIKIYRSDKDKAGNPLKTQDGRPYTRLGLQTKEHGVNWLSGFGNNYNQNWKEGDQVEIEVTTVEKEGKHYLNFRSLGKLELLERRVVALENAFRGLKTAPKSAEAVKDEEIPVFDPKDEEEPDFSDNLPF